jgi:hypothetical protein
VAWAWAWVMRCRWIVHSGVGVSCDRSLGSVVVLANLKGWICDLSILAVSNSHIRAELKPFSLLGTWYTMQTPLGRKRLASMVRYLMLCYHAVISTSLLKPRACLLSQLSLPIPEHARHFQLSLPVPEYARLARFSFVLEDNSNSPSSSFNS